MAVDAPGRLPCCSSALCLQDLWPFLPGAFCSVCLFCPSFFPSASVPPCSVSCSSVATVALIHP